MARLENAFGALHEFAGFESPLHFERFRHEPGVLDGDASLARDSLEEPDFFILERALLAGVDVNRPDDLAVAEQRGKKGGSQAGPASQFGVAVLLVVLHAINGHGLTIAEDLLNERTFHADGHAVHVVGRGAARGTYGEFFGLFIDQKDGADGTVEGFGDHLRDRLEDAVEVTLRADGLRDCSEGFEATTGGLRLCGQAGAPDEAPHLFAEEGDESDFICGVFMNLHMLDIDDANQSSTVYQRHRKEGFEGVFRQGRKRFEAGVLRSFAGQRDDGVVGGYPASNAFTHFQTNIADLGGMIQLRGAKNNFVCCVINEIHQTGVRLGDIGSESYQFTKDRFQILIGTDHAADSMQKGDVAARGTTGGCHSRGHPCGREIVA